MYVCTCMPFFVGITVYELNRSPYLNKFRSPWAIKKLTKKINRCSKEYKKRLTVEAEVLRKLKHPNIVGFRGLWKDSSGGPCLAMEECNCSLGDVIEQRSETNFKPFPVDKLHKVEQCLHSLFYSIYYYLQ